MPKKRLKEQGDIVADRQHRNWVIRVTKGTFCLILSACEFPAAVHQGTLPRESLSLQTPSAFFSSDSTLSSDTTTELDLDLDMIPPKSRALILNRLAGFPADPQFQNSDPEEMEIETQHVFIMQLIEMLYLEEAANDNTVHSLKAIAIRLAQLGETERYTHESWQDPMRRVGLQNLRIKPTVESDTGLQAFDVATCLFQVSDLLVRPENHYRKAAK